MMMMIYIGLTWLDPSSKEHPQWTECTCSWECLDTQSWTWGSGTICAWGSHTACHSSCRSRSCSWSGPTNMACQQWACPSCPPWCRAAASSWWQCWRQMLCRQPGQQQWVLLRPTTAWASWWYGGQWWQGVRGAWPRLSLWSCISLSSINGKWDCCTDVAESKHRIFIDITIKCALFRNGCLLVCLHRMLLVY